MFRDRVDYMVDELALCQDALNQNGYLAAFPSVAFDSLEGTSTDSGGVVVPYYTVHKIMAGLLDAYRYLGNQMAFDVAIKMADYFHRRLTGLSADTLERIFRTDGSGNPQNEFGAMSDPLSELYDITGEQKYLDAASMFNRSWFMVPLASGEDRLEGLHANTHVAEALGIAHTANLSDDETSLAASDNFWRLITEHHSFVIGGNSVHEWLDKSDVEVGPSIDGGKTLPPTTAESCNSHNMLKLTSTLFERTPKMEYADYFERTLYNHILASMSPVSGEMTYFTPLRGHFRTYMNGTYCCTGTGIENTPRYNEGIYFFKENAVWVNLFIPSQFNWEEAGITMKQEGNGGAGEDVTITIIGSDADTPNTIFLRIPFWVSSGVTLSVNGNLLAESPDASAYFPITRIWKTGDVIALTLPASLRLERAKDDNSMVAIFYGPLLFAGELGADGMPNDFTDKDAYLDAEPVSVPDIVVGDTDPSTWLEASEGSNLTYTAGNAGPATGLVFRPLYEVHHQRYSVYWKLQESK